MQVWKRRNHRHRPWWVRHHGCQLSSNTSSFLSIYTESVIFTSYNSHDYILKTMLEELPAPTLLHFPNYTWEMDHWRICTPPAVCPFPFWYWLRQNCVTHVHQLLAICLKSATLHLFESVMQFHGRSTGLQNPIKFTKSHKQRLSQRAKLHSCGELCQWILNPF